MRRVFTVLTAGALLMLAACSHPTHFEVDMPQEEQTDKYPTPDGLGYLGNDLSWEDIADIMSEITYIRFTVTGANGVLETHEFTTPAEASEWMLPLPVGEYDVLVAANMNAANGFELSETVPTKAAHTLPATYARLKNVSSNPAQAWNGIAHVKVEESQMATVHLDLDRLMALFTLKINNVPENSTIDVTVRGAAHYVTLTQERTAGHWGLPSEEAGADIVFEQLNAANAASAINEFKVFPTASGLDKTVILFHIRTGAGLEVDYTGEAPKMENGKKYTLELDYDKLSPYMHITSTSINDWEDGWAYSGEILNPSNN